jgi:hypothetical protein
MTKRTSLHHARIALFASVATLALAPASAHAAFGLAGEWLLDDGPGTVVGDSSGAGRDGQLGEGSATPHRIFGIDGLALHFDGDDEVLMPDSTGLEPPRLTVEAWVRNATTPGSYRYVVSKGATACSASSYGLYTGGSRGLAFYVAGPSGYVVSAQAGAGMIWDGAWHHAVGTYDGDTVRLFVDGAQVGSARAAPASISYGLPSKSLRFGTYRGDCDLPFTGDIDAVRIWNLALTEAEVAATPPIPLGRAQPNPSTPRPGTPAPGTGPGSTTPGTTPAVAGCLTVVPSRRRLRVGRRTTLTATVRKGGRAAFRVRVVLSGKGIKTITHRTDRNGRARFVVHPRRKVALRLRAYGTLPKCAAPVAKIQAR